MTKAKTTKRALFASVLSMMLCMAMLVGSTFAWFTDSVTSGKNRIVAGNLDVELYYSNASTDDWRNASAASDANPNFFVDKEGNDILWEPGVMAVTQFKVANKGSLALKYMLTTKKADFNTLNGRDLSDVIKFAVIENGVYTTREQILALEGLEFDDFTSFAAEGHLLPEAKKTETEPSEEIFTVVAYWEPNVVDDNLYNVNNGQKTNDGADQLYIDIEIQLVATQYTYEKDSFDNQYDRVAALIQDGYVAVATADDLNKALAEGKNVVLTDDIAVSQLNAAEGTVIDGDGNKLIGTNGLSLTKNVEYRNIVFELESGWGVITRSATFINCTFNAASPYLTPTAGGDIVVDGCTFVNTLLQICYNEGEHVDPATIKTTITNNKFAVNNTDARAHAMVLGGGSPEFWANGAKTVTITGNTFTPNYSETSYIAYYIYGDYGTTLTSVPVYKDNTFNGNVNYSMNGTVAENQYPLSRESKVENADDLANALKDLDVKKVSLGNDITTTISLTSEKEIELNDNTIDQYGNVVLTKNGSDVTIKNGTIKAVGSSKAVDIEFGSKVTFENVTFEMTTDQLVNNSAPAYTAVGVRASSAAKTTVVFKNCTFKNQGVDFGGMNGVSEIDVKFENCTFTGVSIVEGDNSSSSLSRFIAFDNNYLYGNVEITNCSFTYSGYLRDKNWKAYAISAHGCTYGETLNITLKNNKFDLKDAAEGQQLYILRETGIKVNKDF